ncbi:Putative sodium-dependent multivitamin transporter [Acromyrmex echinatior]|uniref:Putative sodium-dependent multivitamin transporter n=1 Tax=Acromyrmex echinatior TaxID=103372 RepID=F4W7J8_ACREC|nr:Putative sodium-dependent multivitamin transporter [Acromyrmex echinatior]
MAEIKNTLGWIDYLVIALMLCISIGIGIYHQFSGKHKKTVEYLERRFGVKTRIVASFVYWLQQLFHSGVVLYGPSLALETTTGISKTISITAVGLVCAFYSSIGGIKTVILTDVFQSLLIFIAVLLIIGIAANDVGGLGQIWEIARQGQRLEFDNIDLDPTVRHTWWSLLLGGLCSYLILVGINQAQVQRMLTVKSNNDSSYFYLYRISYMWYSLLGFLITFLVGLLISNLSRLFTQNQNSELDTNLFFPVIARRIRCRQCNNIENEENFPLDRTCSFSNVIHEKEDAVHKICTK